MVDLSAQHRELRPRLDTAIAKVLESGQFVLGPEVTAFEAELADSCESQFAVGVSSGTDALLVSLMALGIGPGDEVVTTAFSFFATAGVIARLGATPVFADIEAEGYNLDPDLAQSKISDKSKAILPVNLYGKLADLVDTDIPIIEDSAQSIGTGGTRGIAACYSFFPTKNIGALGDAGAVVSNDEAFADKVRLLRTHGSRPKYFHKIVGGNFRIDALQAAVLRVKLGQLEQWTEARRTNAALYRELFASSSIPAEVRLPKASEEHVYHQFTLAVPNRDRLADHLKKSGIGTQVYYPQPLHLQACFESLGYRKGSLPNTEAAAESVLSIPIHAQLGQTDLEFVVEQIQSFYQ